MIGHTTAPPSSPRPSTRRPISPTCAPEARCAESRRRLDFASGYGTDVGLRGEGDPMSESVIHRNEGDYPWDVDPDDDGPRRPHPLAHDRHRRAHAEQRPEHGRVRDAAGRAAAAPPPPGGDLLRDRRRRRGVRRRRVAPVRPATWSTTPATRCTAPAIAATAPFTIVWVFPTDTYEEIEYIDD